MADDNDFDEWLDDVETDDDGELDQLNIDALLSAVDDQPDGDDKQEATTELDQTNIDALLGINNNDAPADDPVAATSDDADEMSQDNIDALLGSDEIDTSELDQDSLDALPSGDEIDTSELDQDNIDAMLSSDEIDTSELDQDNIDAMLSSDEIDTSELDQDSLDALPSGDEIDTSELDQDNIDALLSGDDTPDTDIDELDQDNIDALLGSDDGDDELDQDNIDALLGGGDTASGDTGNDEIDQDNIDALLAEDSAESTEDLGDELAQDDLDDLFAESAGATEETPEAEESGDDIDALFNDIDAATSSEANAGGEEEQSIDELFAEDASGDETTLSAEAADEIADTAFDSEFDEMDQLFSELEDDTGEDDDPFQAEEIDFAEMLDTSDDNEDEFLSLGDDEEDEFAALEPEAENDGNETDIDALLTADAAPKTDETNDDDKKGIAIPAFMTGMSKTTLSAMGGTLVLLLIVGLFFMFSGGDDQDDVTVAENQIHPPVPAATVVTQENFIPIAEDTTYTMADNGREMPIELQANDEDGQALIYEITSKPSHGRLSGTAPNFTYLANVDFPGEDSFEYTVTDGVDTSAPALVTIAGPNLKAMALAEKIAEESRKQKIVAKEIKPKQPAVLAKNVHFYTDSTSPVTINWRRIWQEANKSDYDPKVHVEIVKTETAGQLARVTGSQTTFTPDPYAGQTDLIYYRFKKNGFRSATKTISIDISLGNPAPEINLVELQDGYPVGHNVALDAGASRDDNPDSLQFAWKQVSGTPVSMHVSEDNGKTMQFVMPSSFYNKENAGPVFELTATDQTGKSTSKEIATKTISRRQAALWRGNNGGVDDDPALKGKYFPWPYDD